MKAVSVNNPGNEFSQVNEILHQFLHFAAPRVNVLHGKSRVIIVSGDLAVIIHVFHVNTFKNDIVDLMHELGDAADRFGRIGPPVFLNWLCYVRVVHSVSRAR